MINNFIIVKTKMDIATSKQLITSELEKFFQSYYEREKVLNNNIDELRCEIKIHVDTNLKTIEEIKEKDKLISVKDKIILDYENQINEINKTKIQEEESFNNVSMVKAKDTEIKNKQQEVDELTRKLNKANSTIEKLKLELDTLKTSSSNNEEEEKIQEEIIEQEDNEEVKEEEVKEEVKEEEVKVEKVEEEEVKEEVKEKEEEVKEEEEEEEDKSKTNLIIFTFKKVKYCYENVDEPKHYYIYNEENDIAGKKVGVFKIKGKEIDAWKKEHNEDVVYAKDPNEKKRYFYKKTKDRVMSVKIGEYSKENGKKAKVIRC